jgi:SOS response regulatory protein OraA/RecX
MRKEIGICYHYEKRNCEDLEQRQRGRWRGTCVNKKTKSRESIYLIKKQFSQFLFHTISFDSISIPLENSAY